MHDNQNRFPSGLLKILLLGCTAAGLCSGPPAAAQVADPTSQCRESVEFYDQDFTVKEIRAVPLLKFIPAGPTLKDALADAIAKQPPGSPGLRVNEPFSAGGVSLLEAALNLELEFRQLRGRTGLIFARHRLVNCDANARTLEVEYRVLTVARPSYLTANYEANDPEDTGEKQAGEVEEDRSKLAARPLVGYNRSRGIFGGAALSYERDGGLINQFDLDTSGSGSSGVVDAALSGGREYDSGPLSYAEWKFGYRYSNVPSDAVRLKEATVLGQFFGATRPLGSRKLFFRFGASVEGGNRQSDLAPGSVAASNLISSGYGAAKMYVGASLTGRRQDWKASYGLQLGNAGEGASVDFVKHVFDTAYRARFLPREHKPLQIDAQLTAGSLHTGSAGVPVAERFFGGNVEREFIQGDAWRIRSNPVIRSFPQNRLNRDASGLPIGGDSFLSVNLTAAQTVWQRQLLPKQIARDPDVNAGLGGQLLFTRRFLRDAAVQKSQQIDDLRKQIADLAGPVGRLKSELAALQSGQLPDGLKGDIGKFLNGDQEGDGGTPIQDTEAVIETAKLDSDASAGPIDDRAELAKFLNNPVEGNARTLAVDDKGDPADPDDDTDSLITILSKKIAAVRTGLKAAGMDERGRGLADVDAKLSAGRGSIVQHMQSVAALRAYDATEVERALGSLNAPSPGSGKKMDRLLAEIREQLKPHRDTTREELQEVRRQLKDLPPPDQQDAALTQKRIALLGRRDTLIEFRDLLDAADTYAKKANSALVSANDFEEKKQYEEVKNDLESLTVGFGGIVSYVSGLAVSVRDLREPLAERGLTPLWGNLRSRTEELLIIQKGVRREFTKIRVPAIEDSANETISYVGRVLDVFFHELNLVGVSPVVMFDAARLGPAAGPGGGFRYGIGSGLRFSLVNLDLTLGYSANPNRRPQEGRGAFVFSLDIGDLFR